MCSGEELSCINSPDLRASEDRDKSERCQGIKDRGWRARKSAEALSVRDEQRRLRVVEFNNAILLLWLCTAAFCFDGAHLCWSAGSLHLVYLLINHWSVLNSQETDIALASRGQCASCGIIERFMPIFFNSR